MKQTFFTPFSSLAVLSLVLTIGFPAAAQQTLYEDGPINGTVDAWTINFGFVVSNTFTISGGNSTVTGMSFGAWVLPGDVLESVEVSITSQEFGGTSFFDQMVSFTASNCVFNQYGFDVCQEDSTFDGPTLENGTYWMNLSNAVVTNGDPVYWDENSGIGCHSEGCPSQPSENDFGTIPPESFTILGAPATSATSTTSTTPEPESMILFASGLLGTVGILRKKLF